MGTKLPIPRLKSDYNSVGNNFDKEKVPGVLRAALGDGSPTDRPPRDMGDGSMLECGDVIMDSGEPTPCILKYRKQPLNRVILILLYIFLSLEYSTGDPYLPRGPFHPFQ